MDIKDILFSQHCYKSPLWPFPESEPDSLPRYNPIVDSLFEPQSFSFHPDSAENYKLNPTKGYAQFLQGLHELSHSRLFCVKARGLMQLFASYVYYLMSHAPLFIGEDSSLKIPSLDNWEALHNLRLILDALHKTFHEVEEIFAFYSQIKDLTAVYTGQTNGTTLQKALYKDRIGLYPFDQTPSQIEEEFVKEKKEEFGSDFEELYRRYKMVLDKIGTNLGQYIDFYVLNPPMLSFHIELVSHCHPPVFITDRQRMHWKWSVKQLRRSIFNQIKEILTNPTFSPKERLLRADSIIEDNLIFSPKERLSRALSTIEDTSLVGIRTWGLNRFLKLMNRSIPGFIRDCYSYKHEFLPLLHYSSDSRTGTRSAMKKLIYLKKKWFTQHDYENWSQALIKEDLETQDEMNEKITPCSIFGTNGIPILNKNIFDSGFNYLPLLILEALRQQIFEGKGLACPIGSYAYPNCKNLAGLGKDITGLVLHYKYPNCFLVLEQNTRKRDPTCSVRKFMKFIWEHTEVDSNESEWTKPECL